MNRHGSQAIPRREAIAAGRGRLLPGLPAGVSWRPLAGPSQGAAGLETAAVELAAGAAVPERTLERGCACTVLEGGALLTVDAERIALSRLDCLFVHSGSRLSIAAPEDSSATLHLTLAAPSPPGVATKPQRRGVSDRNGYALSDGAEFHDLFAGRFGARGLCGGWARFEPGASLPCHFHDFDESITIVEGRAVCLVEGRRHELAGLDTALVPRGLRHRFLNLSSEPMSMLWVYAGDEPSRTVVDASFCEQPAR